MNTNTKTALIVGITGGIGGEVARVLLSRGWQVRALHRNPTAAASASGFGNAVEWLPGDAMNRADVVAAAQGAAVIVHAVNPPKYHNWAGLVLPMLDNTIAAAKSSGARIVLPGTIYNFGPDAFPRLTESSPQNPLTRKGGIRVEMERRLRAASADGVRTLIVRAGDYFGPRDLGHAWAYLPDVAETIARLLDQAPRLADFDVFHFRGHWLERGADMADAICRAAGLATKKIYAFPWWAMRLAAPFVEVCREMVEMRYLWRVPIELDNTKLRALIGDEPRTPFDQAVGASLDALKAGEPR